MIKVHIRNTYGAILGMDQMCDGTIPDQLRVGDELILQREGSEPVRLTVAALQAHRGEDDETSDVVSIGLRGPGAELVQPEDTLLLDA